MGLNNQDVKVDGSAENIDTLKTKGQKIPIKKNKQSKIIQHN